MKVSLFAQNIIQNKSQNKNVSFEAGLTPKMMQEIQSADVLAISKRLAQKGIPTDFNGNKVVAWCCEKTIDIFEQLNKRFNLKLALPRGIFVRDFETLNIDNPNTTYGFCNYFRTKLYKQSEHEVDGETLFFNSFQGILNHLPQDERWLRDWNNIDNIADHRKMTRQSVTDSFLDAFIHEFSHVVHEDRIFKKHGGEALLKKVLSAQEKKQIQEYQRKYGQKISQICDYALKDPLEAIACDMPRVIVGSIDPATLIPNANPFTNTPYENLSFLKAWNLQLYSDENRPLNDILRNFWNGKFE